MRPWLSDAVGMPTAVLDAHPTALPVFPCPCLAQGAGAPFSALAAVVQVHQPMAADGEQEPGEFVADGPGHCCCLSLGQ